MDYLRELLLAMACAAVVGFAAGMWWTMVYYGIESTPSITIHSRSLR